MTEIPAEYSRKADPRGSIYAAPRTLDITGMGGIKGAGGVITRYKDLLRTAFTKSKIVKDARTQIARSWGQGRKDLPIFRSSEEALTFGADRAGDRRFVKLLRDAATETDVEWKALRKQGKIQEALEVGQEGALNREAAEAIEGKVAPSLMEHFGYKGYVGQGKGVETTAEGLYSKVQDIFRTELIKGLKGE